MKCKKCNSEIKGWLAVENEEPDDVDLDLLEKEIRELHNELDELVQALKDDG